MTKQKSTKRALLMSALALLVCVTMLIGSTFAWFTDSVTSSGNIIKSGTLDVTMEWKDATTNGAQKTYKDASAGAIFNYDLWEPGYVEAKNIKISNVGTLALKYNLNIAANGEVSELADVIDVYFAEGEYTLTSRAMTELTKVGTLSDILKGMPANMAGDLKANTADTVTIALKMQEDAGNKYQGLSIGSDFSVVLMATQDTVEKDSFNNQYDANAKYDVDIWNGKTVTAPVADADGVYHITTAAELVGMMNDSKYPNCNNYQNVVLENNIDLAGRTVSGFGDERGFFDGIFDGQGYTISNFKIDATNRTYYAGLFNQVSQWSGENTVIKNLTVADSTIKGTSQVGAIVGGMNGNTVVENCKVINCDLYATKKVGSVVGYTAGGTVKDCYAENCTVLYSEKDGGEILGYKYTGSTVSNNTANNVSVNQGVAVSSADELVALGGTKINGKYILTADIDMTGKAMKSMEISGGAVVNFDGNGHTISNLNLGAAKLHGMTGAGNEVAGLFDLSAPATTVSLTVSDLTVKNATVSCSGFAAAIVGYNSNGGTVITLNNVDVDGATVTADSVAALVAYSTGKVNLNNCDVKGLTLTGEARRPEKVGAYIGTACTASCVVTVTNCTNGTTYKNYGRVIKGATYK